MGTISTVIPTYNRANFIAEAVDSVLNQKLPRGWNLEVIVVDDGSTDNTATVLKKYGVKIKYLKLKHSGKPATPRNVAIKAATGTIIAFQDSDDLWAEDKLIKQLPLFDNADVVFSFGQAEIIDTKGNNTGQLVVDEKTLVSAKNFEDMLQQNPVSTLTVMARKEAIIAVGGFNEADELRAIEDYDLWLRIAARYPNSLRPIKDTLAYYRRHDQNISRGDTLKGINDAIRIYDFAWQNKSLTNEQRIVLQKYISQINGTYNDYTNQYTPKNVPELSVIMSVFNGQRFLKQAIDSVLSQTYKDFEFIIVDDGSTDNSADIIRGYNDSRIRLIQQTNHGLVASLNTAIGLSRGMYIARMDADDVSLPKRFERELTWLKADRKRGLVSTFFEHLDYKTGKPNGTIVVHAPKHTDLRRALYTVNPFAHGASMFRKKAAVGVGLYKANYWPAEDYDLWRRIAKKWRVGLIPEILFGYRVNNPGSISQSKNYEQTRLVAKIHDELWSEKLVLKSFIHIWRDYTYMHVYVPNEYLAKVREEYLKNQIALCDFGAKRSKYGLALQTLLGILIINPGCGKTRLNIFPKAIRHLLKMV